MVSTASSCCEESSQCVGLSLRVRGKGGGQQGRWGAGARDRGLERVGHVESRRAELGGRTDEAGYGWQRYRSVQGRLLGLSCSGVVQ